MCPYRRHTPPEAETALERLAAALQVYRSESERLAVEFAEAVRACIDAGATWGEVGQQIGITKQAARAHWAPYLERDMTPPHWGTYLRPGQQVGADLGPERAYPGEEIRHGAGSSGIDR